MPSEAIRKIMRHGTSGVVALPPDYRRYHDLHPGAEVKILYGSLLLIVPPNMEEKLREREELIRRVLE